VIDLDAVAREAQRLEPLPASVTRLAKLVCDGAPDLADVVDVVRCDQALTAAVLRTANSSWSGAGPRSRPSPMPWSASGRVRSCRSCSR
jgi:HD-like signal output (HDOD) protein